MTTALFILNLIAALGLLCFGGWITYKGVKYLLDKYNWQPAQARGQGGQAPGSQAEKVDHMLSSLTLLVDSTVAEAMAPRPRPAGQVKAPEFNPEEPVVEPPPDPGVEEPEGGFHPPPDDKKGNLLNGVAKIIEALPSLLKADFGPIVVVCFTGLVVMAGGFYILVMVLNAAP